MNVWNDFAKPIVVLGVICAVSSALLAATHSVTQPIICLLYTSVREFYYVHKDDDAKTLAHAVLSNESFWGEDLTKAAGLTEAVTRDLETIRTEGAYAAMQSVQ